MGFISKLFNRGVNNAATAATATTTLFSRISRQRGAVVCNSGTKVTLKGGTAAHTAPVSCTLTSESGLISVVSKRWVQIPTSQNNKLYLGILNDQFVLSQDKNAKSFVPVAEITQGDSANWPFRLNSISLDPLKVERRTAQVIKEDYICGGYQNYGKTLVINPDVGCDNRAMLFQLDNDGYVVLKIGNMKQGTFTPANKDFKRLALNGHKPTKVGRDDWVALGLSVDDQSKISGKCVELLKKDGQLLVAVTSSQPVNVFNNNNGS